MVVRSSRPTSATSPSANAPKKPCANRRRNTTRCSIRWTKATPSSKCCMTRTESRLTGVFSKSIRRLKNTSGSRARKAKPFVNLGWASSRDGLKFTGTWPRRAKASRCEDHSEPLRRTFDFYAFRIGAPDERKVAVMFTNISDRNRAEEALRESERRTQEHAAELADLHRRKDEFLAMLSHELRNPLSPILNAAHILRLQKD